MSSKSYLIVFCIAFLLCLTFALAKETQQESNKQRPPKPEGSPRPMPSGMPPKPQDSHLPPRPFNSDKPPKKQDETLQSNTESAQEENNEGESHQDARGFSFGMIFAIIGAITVSVSTCLICGATISYCILKKKGYSISLQKKESHQPLREEEEIPSQFMAQVPVVYNQTPVVVHYPIIQQQEQQTQQYV